MLLVGLVALKFVLDVLVDELILVLFSYEFGYWRLGDVHMGHLVLDCESWAGLSDR